VNSLNTCGRIVIFSTESSTLSLREFQQAMLVEDKTVHLVPEDSPSTAMLDTLTPNDLLIVVTTSNGFARRQRAVIERCHAYKVIVTASEDPALHAIFDDVLAFGKDADEGSSLHRIYATFGVTYFFDRLFAQYARAFDPLL
jgi:DNA-binding MurR/RpiR family transcriptional regulator